MIKLDPYIVDFISGNWMAITILLGLLKGMASITTSTTDDKVWTMLNNLFNGLRGMRTPKLKGKGKK